MHKTISDILAEQLPNTQIVPTFGNNDWLFHYQSPAEVNKSNFYPVMFDYWFKSQPMSAGRKDLASIQETFLDGGYYRLDLNPKLSVLALNTLMWNTRNDYTMQGAQIEG